MQDVEPRYQVRIHQDPDDCRKSTLEATLENRERALNRMMALHFEGKAAFIEPIYPPTRKES